MLLRKSSAFSKIVQGEKIVIVIYGKILQLGLKQSMMSMEEVQMAIEEHGVKDCNEVDLMVLEMVVILLDCPKITPIKQLERERSHN